MQKTIQAELSELRKAIDFITAHARDATCKEEDLWKIQLAVEEAILNIIHHGYTDSPGPIHIECSYQEPHFIVAIKDEARPFDPTGHRSCTSTFGIQLLRSLMDDVHYRQDLNANILTLKKLLSCS